MNKYTNYEDEDDDDNFGFSKDHDENWTVKINGVNESFWKNKIDAVYTIIETINSLSNEELTLNIEKITSKIIEIDDTILDIDYLVEYLLNVDADTFNKIIKKLLKYSKVKSYSIKLINNDGSELEFGEL